MEKETRAKIKLFKKKLEQYRFCTFISGKVYNGLVEELDFLFKEEKKTRGKTKRYSLNYERIRKTKSI